MQTMLSLILSLFVISSAQADEPVKLSSDAVSIASVLVEPGVQKCIDEILVKSGVRLSVEKITVQKLEPNTENLEISKSIYRLLGTLINGDIMLDTVAVEINEVVYNPEEGARYSCSMKEVPFSEIDD